MEFFRFLEKESEVFDRRLLILGCLAAVINLFLLFALTSAATRAVQHELNLLGFAAAMAGLFTYWLSQGFVLRRMTIVVEGIVERVRLRIVGKIRYSDLASIENIGRASTYNAVSTHALNVSRGAIGIVTAFSALALLCCASLLILCISVTAFLILAGATAAIIMIFKANQAKVNAWMTAAVRHDNQFVQSFGELIDGFKELKMDSAKADEFIRTRLEPLAAESRASRISAGLALNRSILLETLSLFFVLTALVFLLPVFAPDQVSNLPRLCTFIVFLFGPLGQIVAVYPSFNEAMVSLREIQRVEELLDSIYEQGLADPIGTVDQTIPFHSLSCATLAFSYHDERGQSSFSLQPFDFRLSKGELVFVTGGNGSGKSTFLKVLAGLYSPAHGSIAVNGTAIGHHNRQSYRDLFANVFSEYHLFDYLYGIKEVDQGRVRRLLELTDLLDKTSIVDRQITTINLSSGQRKRLALVLSLLEDKPILLLDEWAAEQDPPFRRKFYREILPWLKQQEKTVVAVTHDDDHYDVADRILKMQFGRFVPGVRN
jgi:putative pyoverdin transport system ATP-binding/permease protein